MKALCFEIWSDYGHIRNHNTNMSQMSFEVLPRTAIVGVLGAIAGVDRSELYETFRNTFISIVPLYKFSSMFVTQNYVKNWYNGKDYETKSPTTIEVMKNPKFRIYFSSKNDDLYKTLKDNINNKTPVWIPYIGNNKHIASMSVASEVDLVKYENKELPISSIIDITKVKAIDYNSVAHINKNTFCRDMNSNPKVPIEYRDYVYSPDMKSIVCMPRVSYQANDEYIMEV